MKAALGMPGILPMALAFRLACVADDDCNGKGAGPPAPSGGAMPIGLGGQGRVLPTRSGGGRGFVFRHCLGGAVGPFGRYGESAPGGRIFGGGRRCPFGEMKPAKTHKASRKRASPNGGGRGADEDFLKLKRAIPSQWRNRLRLGGVWKIIGRLSCPSFARFALWGARPCAFSG